MKSDAQDTKFKNLSAKVPLPHNSSGEIIFLTSNPWSSG
jgi:hypothetical protein